MKKSLLILLLFTVTILKAQDPVSEFFSKLYIQTLPIMTGEDKIIVANGDNILGYVSRSDLQQTLTLSGSEISISGQNTIDIGPLLLGNDGLQEGVNNLTQSLKLRTTNINGLEINTTDGSPLNPAPSVVLSGGMPVPGGGDNWSQIQLRHDGVSISNINTSDSNPSKRFALDYELPTEQLTWTGDVDIQGEYKINGIPINFNGSNTIQNENILTGDISIIENSDQTGILIDAFDNTVNLQTQDGGALLSVAPDGIDLNGNSFVRYEQENEFSSFGVTKEILENRLSNFASKDSSGGTSSTPLDNALSATSTNAVENRAIQIGLDSKANLDGGNTYNGLQVFNGGFSTDFIRGLGSTTYESTAHSSIVETGFLLPDLGDTWLLAPNLGSGLDVLFFDFTKNNWELNIGGSSSAILSQDLADTLYAPLGSTGGTGTGTDNQQLTRSGNILTLEDGGTPIDLSDLASGTGNSYDDTAITALVNQNTSDIETLEQASTNGISAEIQEVIDNTIIKNVKNITFTDDIQIAHENFISSDCSGCLVKNRSSGTNTIKLTDDFNTTGLSVWQNYRNDTMTFEADSTNVWIRLLGEPNLVRSVVVSTPNGTAVVNQAQSGIYDINGSDFTNADDTIYEISDGEPVSYSPPPVNDTGVYIGNGAFSVTQETPSFPNDFNISDITEADEATLTVINDVDGDSNFSVRIEVLPTNDQLFLTIRLTDVAGSLGLEPTGIYRLGLRYKYTGSRFEVIVVGAAEGNVSETVTTTDVNVYRSFEMSNTFSTADGNIAYIGIRPEFNSSFTEATLDISQITIHKLN